MTVQPLTAQPVEVIPAAQPAPVTVVHQPAPVHHVMGPQKSGLETVFGAKLVAIMVVIGVLLMFIGAIVCVQAKVTARTNADPDVVMDKTETAYKNYQAGATLMLVGNMLMCMFLLGASVVNPDIPAGVRSSFLVFCGILVIVTTIIVLTYVGPLLETGPSILD